ncbi:DUF58 domain-containing protein [Amycolatopsis taiwanensis]|uniref:DUF58 domain-containing protein n=1 Tax=Amycolatopsis taiwanensis TaxID=342230 RepID=A0A9W6QWN7_9PSEU|nr:DUF58 domain-containing protein [Amycolatopsis taiwanensis]GLY65103.1 hypothetical protein Atai01_17220 [Amycolatopsis taiwanensis]
MRLTRRGAAVLVAAIVLFGIGQWAGYPLFLATAGAAAGAVIAAVAVTARRPRVAVVRDLYPDRVERGRPAVARLRVRNPGARRQPGFTAGDAVGAGFQSVAVRPLAPGAEAVYHYELPTGGRGRHQVGPLTLDRADALKLGRRRLSTGDTATLWVHPRIYPVNAIAGGHARHHHEGQATEASPRGSLDVREVREYVVGDEVRHLHWKATARTGRLMVRDYADPYQPRFTALLDDRPESLAPPAFEEAVDLAASLAVAAAKADHRCRLVTCGGTDIATRGGTTVVRGLLDELCLLDRADGPGLPLVPAPLLTGGGGTLVVISGRLSEVDHAGLAAVRSRYPEQIVLALGTTKGNFAVPGAKVLSAVDAADAAHRWNAVIAG